EKIRGVQQIRLRVEVADRPRERPDLRLPLRHRQGARGEGEPDAAGRRTQGRSAAHLPPRRDALSRIPRGAHAGGQVLSSPSPLEHGVQGPGGGRAVIDKGRVEILLGAYGTAPAAALADPSILPRVQEYRR